MAARIKGRDVEVRVIRAGGIESSLTAVRSFDWQYDIDVQKEGYLGETADRLDEDYKGVSGNLSLHVEDGAAFDFLQDLADRSQRRIPTFKVTLFATCDFPNGDSRRVMFADCFFATPKVTASGKSAFLEIPLSWSCQVAKKI